MGPKSLILRECVSVSLIKLSFQVASICDSVWPGFVKVICLRKRIYIPQLNFYGSREFMQRLNSCSSFALAPQICRKNISSRLER